MNKIITAGCVAVATFAAVAVPTKTELERAKPVVENMTKADLAAYKAGEKTAQRVAAAHIAYAQKTEGEAAKYLLLQGAFKLYARTGEYDLAADTITAMKRDIKDLPSAVIAEIVSDELRYVSDDKAPRLVAMLKETKRTIALEENTRKVPKVGYHAKTLEQVRKDVAKLFPGWSLDTEVQHLNIESTDSGLHASHRGQNNVICLHPVGEGKSAILSRRATLSEKNPCLFLKVASFAEKVESGACDFLLSVRVNGKDALSKRRICTPDSAPWEDVTVPLSAWRGANVKIEVVLTADGWWYEFPYLSRLEVGEGNGEAKSTVDGHLSFCYSENGGLKEIVGANGQRFVTKWSGCSSDAVYAYRDHVELVGVSDTLRDFPTSSANFVSLDWEQRAPTIKKGAFVVFLNAANEFLCVRVDDVKSKSHGGQEDGLSLTYRAYGADVASAKSILEAHRIAQFAYSIVGNDQGSGEFRYAANGGRLLIQGSQGQRFDTMWSSCSADSVYAYNDYVGHVSTSPNRTSFPATAGEFQSLDWSKRSVAVAKGARAVFRNKSNQYLCVRISDVKSKLRGDSADLIRFDFKIYSTLGAAGEQKNRQRTDLPMNVVADKLQACDFLINKDFKKNAKYYLCLFSASWCGPCRAEMPRIASTYAETLKADPNIELILFSRDQNDEKALAWAKEHDVQFPVVKPHGGNPLDLYARGIPHLFIMKADGTLVEEGHPASLFNEEKLRLLMGERGRIKVNGYTWTYSVWNGEAIIVADDDHHCIISPTPTDHVTIPSALGGATVTCIGHSAFRRCRGLKSIAFPQSVTSVGILAFQGCRELKSAILPAGVKAIGAGAFEDCVELESLTLSGDCPETQNKLFIRCDKLTEIHVPENAKSWAGMKEWQGKKLVFDARAE